MREPGGIGAASRFGGAGANSRNRIAESDSSEIKPEHADGLRQVLEMQLAPILCSHAVDLAREVDHALARQDLSRAGLPAQPGGQVERAAAIAAFDGNGLAGVEPDPDRQRERRVGERLLEESIPSADRRQDSPDAPM